MKVLAFSFSAVIFIFAICFGVWSEVVELFDEDDTFIDKLSRQDTPTQIEIAEGESFNGDIFIRLEAPAAVNNGQRYNQIYPAGATRSSRTYPRPMKPDGSCSRGRKPAAMVL